MRTVNLLRLLTRSAVAFLFLVLALGSSAAQGQDVCYVDTGGNDANNGQAPGVSGGNGPKATIQACVDAGYIGDGDIISIEAGVYDELVDFNKAVMVEARQTGAFVRVRIDDGIIINDDVVFRANTIGGFQDGVFLIGENAPGLALDVADGSLTVQDPVVDGRFRIPAGATVQRDDDTTVSGVITYLGPVIIVYADADASDTDVQAGSELPASLGAGGGLLVDLDGNTLTLAGPLSIGGATVQVNAGDEIEGTLIVDGNATLNGPGDAGSLQVDDGTLTIGSNVAVEDVDIANNDDITFALGANTLTVNGSFNRLGGAFTSGAGGRIDFVGDDADETFQAGPNFSVGTVTVDKDGQTLTILEDIAVTAAGALAFMVADGTTVDFGSEVVNVTANGIVDIDGAFESLPTGGIVFQAAGAQLRGDGTYGNIFVVIGGGGDIVVTAGEEVDFAGILALNSGGIDATGVGSDISPTGENAQVVVALDGANTAIAGSFNADDEMYSLRYTGDLGGGTEVVGTEFATSGITNLVFDVIDGTVDASGVGATVIAGDVSLNNPGDGNDYVVEWPEANVTIQGNLLVADNTEIDTGLAVNNLILEGDNGAHTVNGEISGADALGLDGEGITLTGNPGSAFVSSVVTVGIAQDASATITGIQSINGHLVVGTDASVVVSLGDEQTITGQLVSGGSSVTIQQTANVGGGIDINTGNVVLNANLVATGGVVDGAADVNWSGNGFLVIDGAASLGLNGETIPNLRVEDAVALTSDVVVGTAFVDDNGSINIAGNDLTIGGTLTANGGAIVSASAGGMVVLNSTAATLSGNVSIVAPLMIAEDAEVSIASNDENARIVTVDGDVALLGSLDLGPNSLALNDAGDDLINDGGSIAATTGFVSVAGGDIEPNGTLVIPNLTTSGATVDVGVVSNGTLRITNNFVANSTLNENDGDDSIVFGDGATITLQTFPALQDEATFEGRPNLVYGVVANPTGNEVPASGNVNNLTANAAVTTDQDVTVHGTLTLNAAVDNDTNGESLVLAEGATLALGIDNAAALGAATITATNYNLSYVGPSDTISDAEFLPNATVNTVTIDVGGGDTVTLDKARTLNRLVQVTGGVALAGHDLSIAQDLSLASPSSLTSAGTAEVIFTGAANGAITLGGTWNVPQMIDIRVDKADGSGVTLSGGNMNLRTNSDPAVDVVTLFLSGGHIDTANDVAIVLYQDAGNDGFVQEDESSVVTGNVEKRVYAGDPFGTIPAGAPGAGAQRSARFEFPTGSADGENRPAALTFRSNIPTQTDVRVRHETMSPGGTVGFPLTSGDVQIGNYPDYYWLIRASTSLGQAQQFDVELTGTEIGLPFEDVDDLRIIRRFDGDATTNAWTVQGSAASYDNFLEVVDGDTTAVLRVLNSSGGLVPQAARFTLGIPTRGPTITYADTDSTMAELDGADIEVDEGDEVDIAINYSAQDIGEEATMEVVSLPEFASLEDHGDGTATLTLAPGFDDAGEYTGTLTVTDPSETREINFTITVNDVNQPIIITNAPADTVEALSGRDFSFTLGATDPEGDPITFTLDPDSVAGVTLTSTDSSATFSFIPDLSQVGDTLTFTITVSDGENSVPVTFTVIVTEGELVLGDTSLNGEVTPFDASLVLRHVSGETALNSTAQSVADVSGNGTISAFDAALILQYSAEIIECFPADPECVAAKTIAAATGDLAWGLAEMMEDGLGAYLPLTLSGDVSNVYSVEVMARIDVNLAQVRSVSGTKLPDGWQISYAVNEAGELRIAMAGTQALANAGEFARIAIQLVDENAQVAVTAEGNINERGVTHLGELAAREIPTEFELGSNYPNPFNPTTTFSYSLPESGKVMIQVFDITGRRVRMLVNEEKDAGVYKVQWDGRNDAGMQVASGMYLYQIHAGSFVDAKKMMLVK